MAQVKPIPDGVTSVTPYLVVRGAAAAIEFYTTAFGAKERFRMPGPGGTIVHAEIEIGTARLYLAERSSWTPTPRTATSASSRVTSIQESSETPAAPHCP
jgi:PhnB protein